jgi:hypothetical protein
MLVDAPRGLVTGEMVQSESGILAQTIGGDWESRLFAWSRDRVTISGPEANEIEELARLIAEAGGCVETCPGSDCIEVRAAGRPTVVAAADSSATLIGVASTGATCRWMRGLDTMRRRNTEDYRQSKWMTDLILSSIVRRALLAALAPDMILEKIIILDRRGLAREVAIKSDHLTIPDSAKIADPFADTAEWLNDGSPLLAGNDIDPAFPLTHRAIELQGRGGEPNSLIVEWGLTPREADMRSLEAALEESSSGGAIEISSQGNFDNSRQEKPLNVFISDLDGKASVIWQISELYTGCTPVVELFRWGDLWRASATLGIFRGDALDAEKGDAVATAIGNALSAAQTGAAPYGQVNFEFRTK